MQQLMVCLQKLKKQRFYIILGRASSHWHQKKTVANVIDGNVQRYVLSPIPDKFQGRAEMVLDRLAKSSRVDFVTDIFKQKLNKVL